MASAQRSAEPDRAARGAEHDHAQWLALKPAERRRLAGLTVLYGRGRPADVLAFIDTVLAFQRYGPRSRARRTTHWKQLRAEVYRRAAGCCERCGERGTDRHGDRVLDLHHLTYQRLGRERLADVELVCHPCHQASHGGPGSW